MFHVSPETTLLKNSHGSVTRSRAHTHTSLPYSMSFGRPASSSGTHSSYGGSHKAPISAAQFVPRPGPASFSRPGSAARRSDASRRSSDSTKWEVRVVEIYSIVTTVVNYHVAWRMPVWAVIRRAAYRESITRQKGVCRGSRRSRQQSVGAAACWAVQRWYSDTVPETSTYSVVHSS